MRATIDRLFGLHKAEAGNVQRPAGIHKGNGISVVSIHIDKNCSAEDKAEMPVKAAGEGKEALKFVYLEQNTPFMQQETLISR